MMAATACRTCGTELREGARFCDGCGAPVTEHDTRAEYKQVTVLFADVVHSMGIAAAVGPERLREIMADLADRCAAVVQRYGGTVAQFTGDGIMAVFGAPVALEDHAVRACRAALGIQDETVRLAAEVKRPLRYRPAVTIAGCAFSPPTAATVPEISTAIAHLRDVLGDQTYESLARQGERMSTTAIVTYAYDQIDQARAELKAVSK